MTRIQQLAKAWFDGGWTFIDAEVRLNNSLALGSRLCARDRMALAYILVHMGESNEERDRSDGR